MSIMERSYQQHGPKAVILIHAYTGTPTDVLSVGRALERENYTVLMPTLDGHGVDDPDVILDYGITDWVKTGQEAYQTLVEDGYTDISVFGLSLGGIIATDIMLNNNVKSYGTFSSPVIARFKSNVPENFWIWYKFKKKKLGESEELIESRKEDVLAKLDIVLTGIDEHLLTLEPEYPAIDIPVFIGQGGRDEMINPEIANEFRDALTNATVDFHWYDNAPHVITTGRAGKETQEDLIAFLNENA